MSSLGAISSYAVSVLISISRWACSAVRSPTRGAFGTVGEVLQAAWPRCAPSFPLSGVPGTACTSGEPSLTMRLPAQPTPCLNRAGGRHVIPHSHKNPTRHQAASRWVRHMFGRCSRGERAGLTWRQVADARWITLGEGETSEGENAGCCSSTHP